MFGKIFGTLGAFIGKSLGGGILTTIGRFAGTMLWKYLEIRKHKPSEKHSFKNIHESFAWSKGRYGELIPLIFGTMKVEGKIIWANKVKEILNTTTDKKYFPIFHRVKSIHHETEYEYYLSFAVAICEGEIAEIRSVWANGELINLSHYQHRLYLGTKYQLPDPLILHAEGKVPAFRDLAYVVFTDLPLAHFRHSVPSLSFEVLRKANIKIQSGVEGLVKEMVIIPGSGEYVYDTKVQYKFTNNPYISNPLKRPINSHNYKNIADSVYSLDQVQLVCPNIEWVAVVACWFATSADAGNCLIKPAIEFNDETINFSETWQVGKYNRRNAYVISKDNYDNPIYGGSVNDASIIRYLEEIKKRKLKIMFYPMIFVDVAGKPWRGHISGNSEDIAQFFTKEEGYNNFIMHYANLVKNHVDALVIGSELIGLTKVRDNNNNFPAVDQLCNLAAAVKNIVGRAVKITYAADWSEYHHTAGGWYNLDKLWACNEIDFIGIDAYFPVTSTTTSNITAEDISKGFSSGEGYDYYIDEQQKHDLQADYAWKNLRHWWENYHLNPDNNRTLWQPKMKKIWFTEFGFPSIDKATNQPNVFFDPNCVDGGTPKHSSGEADFSIQRKAIRAFIEYWQTQEYIGKMFLWTWDARPYPAWPHTHVWRDGHLWQKGHWVNNKFGVTSLGAVLLELSHKAGIKACKIDLINVDESLGGIIFDKDIKIIDAINLLRIRYFFDLTTKNSGKILFIMRGYKLPYKIATDMLTKIVKEHHYISLEEIAKEFMIQEIEIYFLEQANQYNYSFYRFISELESCAPPTKINLPMASSTAEMERLCRAIIKNSNCETAVIKFLLPITYLECEPTDFIELNYNSQNWQLRITDINIINYFYLQVVGIVDDVNSYHLTNWKNNTAINYQFDRQSQLLALDLAAIVSNNNDDDISLYIFFSSVTKAMLCGKVINEYVNLNEIEPAGDIGEGKFCSSGYANIFVIDDISYITIQHNNFLQYVTHGWNLALCGDEIIKFKNWEKTGENSYKIFTLIRGHSATERYINKHFPSERFLLLTSYALKLPISKTLINETISLKLWGSSEQDSQQIILQNNYARPIAPFIKEAMYDGEKQQLQIQWITRINPNTPNINKNNLTFNIILQGENINVLTNTTDTKIIIDMNSYKDVENFKLFLVAISGNITSRESNILHFTKVNKNLFEISNRS